MIHVVGEAAGRHFDYVASELEVTNHSKDEYPEWIKEDWRVRGLTLEDWQEGKLLTRDGHTITLQPRYVGGRFGKSDGVNTGTVCTMTFDGEYVATHCLFRESEVLVQE